MQESLPCQTGAKDNDQARDRLTEIVRREGLRCVMVSADEVAASLDLPAWGRSIQVEVISSKDFQGRDDFKDAVFDRAEAGIIGADFAIAESGTLGLIHNEDQPRLISLAPMVTYGSPPPSRPPGLG